MHNNLICPAWHNVLMSLSRCFMCVRLTMYFSWTFKWILRCSFHSAYCPSLKELMLTLFAYGYTFTLTLVVRSDMIGMEVMVIIVPLLNWSLRYVPLIFNVSVVYCAFQLLALLVSVYSWSEDQLRPIWVIYEVKMNILVCFL